MLAELVNKIQELTNMGAFPNSVLEHDARVARWFVGGRLVSHDMAFPPRGHRMLHVDDVISLVNSLIECIDGPPAVWYSEDAVIAVLDGNGHRVEQATLQLIRSDVFARIVELNANRAAAWLDQKAFVRLLRIELAGTLPPAALLEIVRRVKFENGTVTEGTVQRERESLGRSITSAVSAEREIPEEVVLETAVYKTAGLTTKVPVRCSIEVDAMQGKFRLLPLPDAIEGAERLLMAEVRAALTAGLNEKVPTYYGKP